MRNISLGHKALFLSFLYFAVVALVLFISLKSDRRSPQTDIPVPAHINQQYKFARSGEPACDQLDVSRLMLYVDGMNTGLRAVGCTDGDKPSATFWLRHEGATPPITPEVDQAAWSTILGDPLSGIGKTRTLDYDIRWVQEGRPVRHLAKADSKFSYYIFEWWSPFAGAVVLYVWGLLIYLARNSALLRDAGEKDAPLASRTFSLAKTQMAWWFAIIFASFVFLWLVTGEMPSLSGQALSLLGIASATTIASVGMSSGRRIAPGESDIFFRDLLSDANGIAIQRFQMLVMTMALGVMFLMRVATRLTMPEFDASMLTLLGISAGTYVGMKIPEDQGGAAKVVDPVAGDPKSGAPTH